jgi:NADH-quinone oxidoreductase subunit E
LEDWGFFKMLTKEELHEIDHEIAKYPVREAAGLDSLIIVQRHRGYVSDEMLLAIAAYLQMSPTELDSIATFYNLIYRKPVGKCVIRLCDSVSCYIRGYEAVRKAIKNELGIDFGQTTTDKKFTLLPTQCLGTCDHAPAMMVNDDLFRDLEPEKVADILKSCEVKEKRHEHAAHEKLPS